MRLHPAGLKLFMPGQDLKWGGGVFSQLTSRTSARLGFQILTGCPLFDRFLFLLFPAGAFWSSLMTIRLKAKLKNGKPYFVRQLLLCAASDLFLWPV